MSNPLEHALVPVANGAMRSGGKELIAGETVEQFWMWKKHIQDLHLKSRKVVWMNVADALIANEKAAEIREAGQTKVKVAKVSGTTAALKGVVDLIETLDKQRQELEKQAMELAVQLEREGVDVEAMFSDEGRRPEDDESDGLEKPTDPIEAATGLKLNEPASADEDEEGDNPAIEPVVATATATVDVDGDADVDALDDVTVAKIQAWADKMPYRDLQKEAGELGISSFGVKSPDLVRLVVEAAIVVEQKRRNTGE